jgi:hypothetical protein
MITRINRFEAKTGSEDAVFEFLKSIIAIRDSNSLRFAGPEWVPRRSLIELLQTSV